MCACVYWHVCVHVCCTCMCVIQLIRGEYDEALELAREYELDSDLVHQRQWHNYQVSISTIQDYLVRQMDIV